jgi:hypothetical protein
VSQSFVACVLTISKILFLIYWENLYLIDFCQLWNLNSFSQENCWYYDFSKGIWGQDVKKMGWMIHVSKALVLAVWPWDFISTLSWAGPPEGAGWGNGVTKQASSRDLFRTSLDFSNLNVSFSCPYSSFCYCYCVVTCWAFQSLIKFLNYQCVKDFCYNKYCNYKLYK